MASLIKLVNFLQGSRDVGGTTKVGGGTHGLRGTYDVLNSPERWRNPHQEFRQPLLFLLFIYNHLLVSSTILLGQYVFENLLS